MPRGKPADSNNDGDTHKDETSALPTGNAFARDFIHRFDQQEAPPHTYASLAQGPWEVRRVEALYTTPMDDASWGCYAYGEQQATAFVKYRYLALILAAALPSASLPPRFTLDADSHDPVLLLEHGEEAGTLRWADDELVAAVNVLAALLDAPRSLAQLLLAAGAPVLERTGKILDHTLAGDGS